MVMPKEGFIVAVLSHRCTCPGYSTSSWPREVLMFDPQRIEEKEGLMGPRRVVSQVLIVGLRNALPGIVFGIEIW